MKYNFDYNYVYQRYVVDDISLEEMSAELGITKKQLKYVLGKMGISKKIAKQEDPAYIKVSDRDWLENEFQGKSASTIARELGVSEGKVEYYLDKYNIRKHFVYVIDEAAADIRRPEFCYFAGLVATDGHLDKKVARVTVSLSGVCDELALQALAEYFSYRGSIYNASRHRKVLCMSSQRLVDELEKMGVYRYSDKTFDVKVPPDFYSEDCKRMYVRGCIDGDGNIKRSNGIVRLLSASKDFLYGLTGILNSSGFEAVPKVAREKYYQFEMRREPSKNLLKWLYQGYEDFRLERKFNTALSVWGNDIV